MKESIAFWYEPIPDSDAKPPEVELHFNLWRDLLVRDTNFFDVGIKFLSSDEQVLASAANSFSLFIPGRFEKSQCIDLSTIMDEPKTLNAVFNDVVRQVADHGNAFELEIGTQERLLFHRIDVANDIDTEAVGMDDDGTGTIFKFQTNFCQRVKEKTNHYLRVRFKLDRTTRSLFFFGFAPIRMVLAAIIYKN